MKKKYIGIDFGKARIGMAIAENPLYVVLPLQTIFSGKTLEETIEKIFQVFCKLDQASIATIVIGKPLLLTGEVGKMAHLAEEFAKKLEEKLPGIPIKLWDERFSSSQADQSLKATGLNRKKRSKHVDALSSMIILESYLVAKKIV